MVDRDAELPRPLDPALRHAAEILLLALRAVREGRADLGLGERLEGDFAFLVGILEPCVGHHRGAAVVVAPVPGLAVGVRMRVWVVIVRVGTAGAGELDDQRSHGHLDVEFRHITVRPFRSVSV